MTKKFGRGGCRIFPPFFFLFYFYRSIIRSMFIYLRILNFLFFFFFQNQCSRNKQPLNKILTYLLLLEGESIYNFIVVLSTSEFNDLLRATFRQNLQTPLIIRLATRVRSWVAITRQGEEKIGKKERVKNENYQRLYSKNYVTVHSVHNVFLFAIFVCLSKCKIQSVLLVFSFLEKKKRKDYYNYILHVQLTLSFPLCLPVSFASFLQPSSNTIFKYHHQTFNVHPTNCNSLLFPRTVFKKNIPRSIGYFAEGGESPIK